MPENFEVAHNPKNLQFEVRMNDHLAELVYRIKNNEIYLMHTGVPKPIENLGIAKALTEYALKYSLENGYKIIAYCPYVRAYMQKHPDWKTELS